MRSNDVDIMSFISERDSGKLKDLQEDLFDIHLRVKQTLDGGVSASEVDSLRALLECSQAASEFVALL